MSENSKVELTEEQKEALQTLNTSITEENMNYWLLLAIMILESIPEKCQVPYCGCSKGTCKATKIDLDHQCTCKHGGV